MANNKFSCGLNINVATDLSNSLTMALSYGYHFITTFLVNQRYRQEFLSGKAKNRAAPFTRSDLALNTTDWNSLMVYQISSWINLESEIEVTRLIAEKTFEQEVNYCLHLGVPAIIVELQNYSCINMARCVNSYLSKNYTMVWWIHVPMVAPQVSRKVYFNDEDENEELCTDKSLDTWEWWNRFRFLCSTDKRLYVALELDAELPDQDALQRWQGEQIGCLIIPTHIFMTNKKNYPVLSKPHQQFVQQCYKREVQIVIKGSARHGDMRFYQQYLEYLWKTQPQDDVLANFSKGYEDYLQIPLQPLMDNLESSTYEVFEKDPVKYTEYQEAMFQAIVDKMKSKEAEKDKLISLAVVGAGRGPLVRAALLAAEHAKARVQVYAIEKNPNAIVTLLAQKREIWADRVTVVATDMREYDPDFKFDIIVSELLGSFGDNELSPECLDGAQNFLKEDGIMIPSSYTSYVAPIQSPKIYGGLNLQKEREKHPFSPYEMPYVVRLHNHNELAEPQSLFTFVHPNKSEVLDNSRFKTLHFEIQDTNIVHGFAGYFDTILYKNVTLSIKPSTHSPGMFSWFPIFIPLKDPVYVEKNSILEVNFWRCCNKRDVWYEWSVTSPVVSYIHNPNGRSYKIGL